MASFGGFMEITQADRVRMERAHVAAWPALRTADIDGWLWRRSGGGSQRANSVSTVDFGGGDIEAAVAEVENRYRALAVPARFQTFDETLPAGLADFLRRRGYRQGDETVTMFKRIAPGAGGLDVVCRDAAWTEWLQVYTGEITESRLAVNVLILDRVPGPRAFFGCVRGGEIVATALCVVAHGCAVVECVTTRADCRRQGAAVSVMTALEAWAGQQNADLLGLQVVARNVPAVALYQRLRFVAGARNMFWSAAVSMRAGDVADTVS